MPRSATRGLGRSFNVLTTAVLAPGSDHPRGTCATSTPSRQHMSTRNEVQSSGTEQPRAPRALRLERIQGTTSRSGGRAPPTRAVVWPQTIRESGHLRPSHARPKWTDDRGPFFFLQIFPNSSQASWRTRHSASRTRGGDGNQGVDKSHSWDRRPLRGVVSLSEATNRRHMPRLAATEAFWPAPGLK